MNSIKGASAVLGVLVLLAIFPCIELARAYDPLAASNYAYNWYNSQNPAYNDYQDDSYSHEDANFVSQALIAGGLLNSENITYGNDVDGHGCITNRASLAEFIKDYEHAQKIGFKVDYFVPTSLAYGDVVFFGDETDPYKFVGVVTGYNPVWDDFMIAYHTNTSGGTVGGHKSLTELMLVFGGATFYHITKPEETNEKQRFYGTGWTFAGPGALSAEIFKPGDKYLGYIVSNSNRNYQDMVIATDTSLPKFKGCSYLIAGYCCDPEKHAPELGQTFGQPWTSDSPNHWAYWVRQAVLYAVANGLEYNLLNAVWYIVDRAGYPDEIITGIGYPEDGPMKKEMVYLPLLTRPGVGVTDKQGSSPEPLLKKTPRPNKDFNELYKQKLMGLNPERTLN